MAVTILYFAGLRDISGRAEEQCELPSGVSVKEALSLIQARHPRMHFEGVRCALNEEFVDSAAQVNDGDTLALIPPVSGG